MVSSYSEDFTVTWKDPADAAIPWTPDLMHFPRPLPPLTTEVLRGAIENVFNGRFISVNGYAFMHNYAPPPPTPEVIQRGAVTVWQNEYLPLVKTAITRTRTTDYDGMSAVQLAQALPQIIRDAVDAFRYTMVVVFGFMMPTMQLVAFCEQELGEEGERLLVTMLQGFENESASAGAGLAQLAEKAASLPAVADALRAGRYGDVPRVAGGPEFMAAFDDHLKEYGWQAESWSLVHVPTWIEEPEVALMLIGRYISDPARSPSASIQRAIQQREDAAREMRARLSPDKLPQFEAMLQTALSHVSISESRALHQLLIIGSLRVPTLAMGRKLVANGSTSQADDVFFLHLDEILKAAESPDSGLKATIHKRRADLARWEKISPPPFLGAPPTMEGRPPEVIAMITKFLGIGRPPSMEAGIVTGFGASKGTYRGRARVIHELRDAGRLEPGDVLVCSTTAPPWTPLFAIAGAVVTDTGGILSHSAICAREYAIPCVVGTTTATQKIPDGAMVTVDGSKGIVTIEG